MTPPFQLRCFHCKKRVTSYEAEGGVAFILKCGCPHQGESLRE